MLVRANRSRDGEMFSGMGVYEGVGADNSKAPEEGVTIEGSSREIAPSLIKTVSQSIVEDAVRSEEQQFSENYIKWGSVALAVVCGGLAVSLLFPPKKPVPAAEKTS